MLHLFGFALAIYLLVKWTSDDATDKIIKARREDEQRAHEHKIDMEWLNRQ